jgi:electron-transferring-flavoprotein dehydrogenase
MMETAPEIESSAVPRQGFAVDIACVGFGPAMGGFLTTLARGLYREDGTPRLQSTFAEGMPLQIACYERADDIAFGVSGVATRARGLKTSLPDFNPAQVHMAAEIQHEHVVYLLDPVGASRRPTSLRVADRLLRAAGRVRHHAWELPWIPAFLRKEGGLILSIGQFNQWVGNAVMGSGAAVIWPGSPVKEPLIDGNRVVGVRLVDQGTDRQGLPADGFMPGMDVHAALTVVGDGPVGAVGRRLDEHFGMPPGHEHTEWAVGTKMVVDLPEDSGLEAGTIFHTFGYPEPEIFGFLYVHNPQLVSLGIFVPSWFQSPARTSYRYLQHWMLHPFFWRFLQGGRLRSWGAKSLQESGRKGEPWLVGDGWARIGEGSGSTNVLTGSGVDEAWTTGVQLAEAVQELLESGRPFTRENLEATYVRRRRASWVEREGRVAERARNGFQRSFLWGMLGMGLAGLTNGRITLSAPRKRMPDLAEFYGRRIPAEELEQIRQECEKTAQPLHDRLMDRAGWPPIPFDGKLLVSQQDALLLGGKVQAPAGYADHVVFLYPEVCRRCGAKVCVELCSGQALQRDLEAGVRFDREKCVHCGVCLWNCSEPVQGRLSNIEFRAGTGGLHSAEN